MDDIGITWVAGIASALQTLADDIRRVHAFLLILAGGHPALARAVQLVEEDYAWLIKTASELDGEVIA